MQVELHNFLIPRNYNNKLINTQFQKVRELPGINYTERRKLALMKKQKGLKSDRKQLQLRLCQFHVTSLIWVK